MTASPGTVAIVTGASSGIGRAAAAALAANGLVVVIAARRLDRLEELSAEIAAAGGRAVVVRADVTSDADRQRLCGEALRITGRIDVLVNNAGYGQRGPIESVPIDEVRNNFESNVFGPIALAQLAIGHMRAAGSGRIINVSSVAGRIARPFSSVYDATKHAIEAFSDGMRAELAPFGIHVIAIEPGFIHTEFTEVAEGHAVMTSPYEPYYAAFRRGEARQRRLAGTATEIAELIVEAARSPHPRARYAAPRVARIALLLKRLLPDAMFERLASPKLSPVSKQGTGLV